MREILFRGKRVDNGEWVYGNYIKSPTCQDLHMIEDTNPLIMDGCRRFQGCPPVDPATVGQYTGLTANGKKIFEGDIVRIFGNQDVEDWKNVDYTALIAFLDGGFCALDGTIEDHGFRRYALARMDFYMEVIGNIYDNPELLEEVQ